MKECPVCHNPLREIPKYGVLIDACPGCRGVWLDRGELEKIVALSRDFQSEGDYNYADNRKEHYEHEHNHHYEKHHGHGHGYGHHDGYHPKKKKKKLFDLFEDLFD